MKGLETCPSWDSTLAPKKVPTDMACGSGSVMPMTATFAWSERMASIAIFRETLKPEHAAIGAMAGPVMWASMEI